MSLGLSGLRLGLGSPRGSSFPGYTLPNAVDVHYDVNLLPPAVDGSNKVTTLYDIKGLANATPITTGTVPAGGAPTLVTDSLGRRALLFAGANALEIADTLAAYTTSGCTVYAVVRYLDPNTTTSHSIFSAGRNANASALNNTKAMMTTTNGIGLGVGANSFPGGPALGNKPLWDAGGVYGTERVTGSRAKMLCHSGVQVVAISGGVGTTALIHMNDEYCSAIGAPTQNTVTTSGGEIGRYAFSPASSNYASILLYALVIKRTSTGAVNTQANIAAMMTAYGISSITNQLILEGDSRFADFGATANGASPTEKLAVKVADRMPAGWRVIRNALSNSTIDKDIGAVGANIDLGMRDRRDYGARSMFGGVHNLSGRNVVAVEVWHNDDGTAIGTSPIYTQPTFTAARADEIYANLQNLVCNDATSYLSKGWEYLASITMPGSNTKDPSLDEMRIKFRSANFFHDFLGAVGDTYEGKVRRAETPLCVPVSGAWGSYVLDDGLGISDTRITSNGGIWFADQAHETELVHPYIAQCLADATLRADPYV